MDEGNMEQDALQDIFDGIIEPTDIKFSALERITRNFSEEQIIGEGGFGIVYKGMLRNGLVAVKRIRNDRTIREKTFQQEVTSLLHVSHKNIVRFLGFCSHTIHKALLYEGQHIYAENRDRLLCFEYINNGSLETYITDELRGLEWDTRYFIVKGICEGLQYLHEDVGIIHRDLKTANILIDSNMVAKITDFGLSRLEQNAQTRSTTRVSSPGYTAPEYIERGEMSFKYDMYSLGVIIIELVTGSRSFPITNNVLRRWSHRWHKSGKETQFRYDQIAKLIEFGLLCQEKDPCKRPFISDIIHVINELECAGRHSNANGSTLAQISPYSEDDMLGIEPLEICFPFELNKQISCSLKLTNETNAFIAFSIQKTSPLPYCIQPNKDIMAPQSKCTVNITLQPLEKAPQDKCTGNFIVRSTKVNYSGKIKNVTEDVLNTTEDKLVDEVNLTIRYESLIISDTRNLHGPQEEAESKINASTSDEVIQLDPPELRFPLVPHKKVLSSFRIINVTESYISFNISYIKANITAKYALNKYASVMPPRSTECLKVKREVNENAVKEMQSNDEFQVWYALVDEDIKADDFNIKDYNEHKKLPVVLTEGHSCTSNELIQFDPPELSFPLLTKTSLSSVNIINITDCYIGFDTWFPKKNDAFYQREPRRGILPPRSTQRMVVRRILKEQELEGKQCKDEFLVWNMIVGEGVQASSIQGYQSVEDSKELPLTFIKPSPCASNELIQFDPPEISLPFSNKPLVFSFNIANITDFCASFDTRIPNRNVGMYDVLPESAVMPPGSTQRIVVKMIPKKKEQEDGQYEDVLRIYSGLGREGVEASDFVNRIYYQVGKDFQIVYTKKTSLCTSEELIQFDSPQLTFPILPNKRVSMLRKFKIVNITDHIVGFHIWDHISNLADYTTEPSEGIVSPRCTQEIKIRRTPGENETENMECKDKIFVWNGIVAKGIQASDVCEYFDDGDKELPVVLTKGNKKRREYDDSLEKEVEGTIRMVKPLGRKGSIRPVMD